MAPIVPSSEAIDSLFIKSLEALSPQAQSKPCSNSALTETAITSVIQKVRPDAKLAFVSPSATPTRFRILYAFDVSKNAPTDRINVEITQALSEDDAGSAFKDKLGSFERNINDTNVVWPWQDKQLLGTRALQTPEGIFWVHGTSFLDVASGLSNNVNQTKTVLSDIAKALDSYLLEKPATQAEMIKVIPKLKTKTPISQPQGSTIEIEVDKDDNFSTVKRVDFSEDGILVPIEFPDTANIFRFLAQKPGKVTVRLVFAHKNTLMVATSSFEVTVTQPLKSQDQETKDFLAGIERELGWPST